MPRIPTIPGAVISPRSEQDRWLKSHVARLCQLDHERYSVQLKPTYRVVRLMTLFDLRFPGSQPISFASEHLQQLEHRE
jgi:mRNA guanylyltransferase